MHVLSSQNSETSADNQSKHTAISGGISSFADQLQDCRLDIVRNSKQLQNQIASEVADLQDSIDQTTDKIDEVSEREQELELAFKKVEMQSKAVTTLATTSLALNAINFILWAIFVAMTVAK